MHFLDDARIDADFIVSTVQGSAPYVLPTGLASNPRGVW